VFNWHYRYAYLLLIQAQRTNVHSIVKAINGVELLKVSNHMFVKLFTLQQETNEHEDNQCCSLIENYQSKPRMRLASAKSFSEIVTLLA